MSIYQWSQTAATNANADPSINWAEGQAPSSVNDSARAMMAVIAKNRDDISGAIVTAGTSTAYTVSSNSGFDTLAHLGGQIIAFTPHTTNGATVTLNVDALGPKPLRSAPSVELQAGTIIQGTPYVALYNSTDGAFYLHNFFANPYNVPLGAGMDYWLTTAPNSSFVFPFGQAISRTTYSTLFAAMGTTFGPGDGSTTFNLPDKRGRASFSADNMGGSGASRLTTAGSGVDGTTIGAAGGAQNHTLIANELPANIPSSATTTISGTSSSPIWVGIGANNVQANAGSSTVTSGAQNVTLSTSVTINSSGGGAHVIMNPAIVCNYIMRII